MRIKGKVELFTPTLVSGWLAVFGKPDEPVRLELLLDGVSIALSAAQAFRPLLQKGFPPPAELRRFFVATVSAKPD